MGIRKTFTSAYHPQTDGLVERFNGILARILSHYVEENQGNWDQIIPFALMAYRSA